MVMFRERVFDFGFLVFVDGVSSRYQEPICQINVTWQGFLDVLEDVRVLCKRIYFFFHSLVRLVMLLIIP